MLERAGELQRQTLRIYGELMARRESWAGRMVFACGAGVAASGLPAAVSIAGGAALLLDPDAVAVKAVFRQGGVDFVVNTLDEALRVLKNEIRKGRSLSVVLEGEGARAVEELQQRGVLPDVQMVLGGAGNQVDGWGKELLSLESDAGTVRPSEELRRWLEQHRWTETELAAKTTAELRQMDGRLLAMLPAADRVRRAWVQRIARYQRPEPGGARVVWLAEAERVLARLFEC
ncbi:MAG: hypothetical protein ACP5E5_12960 [Acidobacteriaceae bacterium]